MSTQDGDALRLEGVQKTFDKNEVLKGIDLTLAPHEVVCLIGASGSGKSTLLKCVNLTEPVTEGRIFVDGEEITDPDADVDRIRQHIGIVFQSFNLFPHMSVMRNVTLGPRKALGSSASRRRPRPRNCSSASASRTSATSIRTGSRAVSSSGPRSSARWQ